MSLLKSSGGQGLWSRYVIGGHLVTCDLSLDLRRQRALRWPWSGQFPHPFIRPHSLHATLQTPEARAPIRTLMAPHMGLASIIGAPETNWQ